MSLPRARYTPSGAVELTFPYRRELIEAIKTRIPSTYRAYDPDTKVWTVAGVLDWPHAAVGLLRAHFPGAEVVGAARSEPAPIRRHDPDYAALHLLPSAPAPVVEAAYRALSKLHHPDRGGDAVAMVGLNAAVERLRDRGVA